MKRRIWTVAAGLGAVVALVVVPSALAKGYTSPKLQVQQAGATTVIKASLSPDDDPTASVRIYAPTGTQLTTNQAPGTVLGPVKALVKALDLGGADLEFSGQLVVAAPGQVPAAIQAACTQGATPLATWVLALSAAGQAVNVPAFLVPTSGAQAGLGPAYIQVCLAPPDTPAGSPGRAVFGAKLYSAQLSTSGVFSAVPVGAWIAFWTPYNPGVGTVNVAGTVASPAAIAPGTVTAKAKKVGLGAIVSGQVTQAGSARGGAAVTIFGGVKKTTLKKLGTIKATPNGAFSFRAKRGVFFKARAVAAAGSAAPLCTALAGALSPTPCVNPTVNGFTVTSKVVKRK